MLKKIGKFLLSHESDEKFLDLIHLVERLVSKILSVALLIVIIVGIYDLIYLLIKDLTSNDLAGFYNKGLIEIFGLFLNILIALELMENITAYLKKNVIYVELVIVTALIAVSRKIIIFDFAKKSSQDLIAVSIGIIALSISYWLIKSIEVKNKK